jgi:hypothetical protein
MTSRFRHVALIGKYQASGARAQADARDGVMENIGAFLESQGCTVFVERSTCEEENESAPPIHAMKPCRSRKSASDATWAWWSAVTAPCSASAGSSPATAFR